MKPVKSLEAKAVGPRTPRTSRHGGLAGRGRLEAETLMLRPQMYAFSIASAQVTTGPLQYQLKAELMLQPPFDMMLHRVRRGA